LHNPLKSSNPLESEKEKDGGLKGDKILNRPGSPPPTLGPPPLPVLPPLPPQQPKSERIPGL
jgi:hypothetical protein